ncbi:hypothetical protein DXT96_25670 [Agrobacterium sp. ICMP 6402]|nr:hypothetical protein [Agrobacterium sp. ICMP 6402]
MGDPPCVPVVEEQTAASHSLAREAAALFELLEQFTFDDVSRTPLPSSRVVRQPVPATPMRACSGSGAYATRGSAALATKEAHWEELKGVGGPKHLFLGGEGQA